MERTTSVKTILSTAAPFPHFIRVTMQLERARQLVLMTVRFDILVEVLHFFYHPSLAYK